MLESVNLGHDRVVGNCSKRSIGLNNGTKIKAVCITLSLNFCEDMFIIIISQSSAEFVIVHVGFVFPPTPEPGDLVRVHHSELTDYVFPSDGTHVLWISKQF